jgi:hypothetical protein
MAATSQHILVSHGTGIAEGTYTRAVRLARMWILMKENPYTVKQLCVALDVHWATVYRDLIDLQITPLEDGCAPILVTYGQWHIAKLNGP